MEINNDSALMCRLFDSEIQMTSKKLVLLTVLILFATAVSVTPRARRMFLSTQNSRNERRLRSSARALSIQLKRIRLQ